MDCGNGATLSSPFILYCQLNNCSAVFSALSPLYIHLKGICYSSTAGHCLRSACYKHVKLMKGRGYHSAMPLLGQLFSAIIRC
jgi:hypothetical protein